MTRSIYFVSEFISTFIKIWVCFGLIDTMAKPRWSERTEYIVKLVTTVLLAGLSTGNNVNALIQFDVLFSNLMLLFIAVVVTLTSKTLYRYPLQYIFNVVFLFFISITLLDFFTLAILYLVLGVIDQNLYIFTSATLARAMYLLLFSAGCIRIGKKVGQWLRREPKKKYHIWITLSIVPLCVFLTQTQGIYIIETYATQGVISIGKVFGMWGIFGLIAFVTVLLFIVYHIRQKDAEERRLQQLKLHMLESNYQSLMQVYEEKAILLHDIKNHIQMIREMVEHDEKLEVLTYLDTMSSKLLRSKHRDLTNHKLLNLILNMKFHEAETAGIAGEYEFDDMSQLRLKPMEICALFTNVLDNAIEANQKLAADVPRYIHMSCIRKNNMLLLNLANPVAEDVKVVDGELPFTTKEDKQFHGFGMRSVRQILETYEGHMRIDVECGEFLLTAYLQGFSTEEK